MLSTGREALLLFLTLWLGCTTECGGPSCVSAWPVSRLHVIPVTRLRERDPLAGSDQVVGTLAQGADWSVAGAGGQLLVGMPEAGVVVLLEPPEGAAAVEDLEVLRLEVADERFGASVAWRETAGEPEIWVGAPGADGGRGAVYRYSAEGELLLRLVGGSPADGLGERVQTCRDLDGDGLSDVVATAPRFLAPEGWDPLPSLAGALFVIAERTPGLDVPVWERGPAVWGAQPAVAAGADLVCSADLTGDGRVDLLVGAPFVDDVGAVYVRAGGAGFVHGPLRDDEEIGRGTEVGERYGMALEVLAGSPVVGRPGAVSGEGAVSLLGTAVELSNPRRQPDHVGRHLAVGDLDGDGTPDLWVGAPDRRVVDTANEARTRYDAGWAGLWYGPPTAASPDRTLVGTRPFQRIGRSTVLYDLHDDGELEILEVVRDAPEASP